MFVLLSAVAANLMALPAIDTKFLKPDFKATFNEGGAAAVQVRLVVSPTGVPIRCERAFLNGPSKNVEAFCSMLQTRARFSPALNGSGQPSFGVVNLWSHWSNRHWAGSDMPSWEPADLTFETNKMPKGFPGGSMFRLVVATDAIGTVGNCGIAGARLAQQVVDFLCHEAAAEKITPAMNESGDPVSSIQEFIIRLTPKAEMDKLMKRLRGR